MFFLQGLKIDTNTDLKANMPLAQFSMGNISSNGGCSIDMLVFLWGGIYTKTKQHMILILQGGQNRCMNRNAFNSEESKGLLDLQGGPLPVIN